MLDHGPSANSPVLRMRRRRFFDDINIALGASVMVSRRAQAISRETLAKAIGVSVQQMRKYETGENRIAVPRLIEIAAALQVSVAKLLANVIAAREDDEIAPQVLLSARSPSVRRLLDVAQKLFDSRRPQALSDLADLAEHMVER